MFWLTVNTGEGQKKKLIQQWLEKKIDPTDRREKKIVAMC